jgi:hypothetical protein
MDWRPNPLWRDATSDDARPTRLRRRNQRVLPPTSPDGILGPVTSERHVVAVALSAALALASACGGSHPQSAAQLHRHYFLVGKRACKRLVKHTASSVTIYAVDFSSYPARYRHDVARGCAAD